MIDGRTLTKQGAEVEHFNFGIAYDCASCGCSHTRHFEVRERYVFPKDFRPGDRSIAFDSRRVLAQGCDDCTCAGLC